MGPCLKVRMLPALHQALLLAEQSGAVPTDRSKRLPPLVQNDFQVLQVFRQLEVVALRLQSPVVEGQTDLVKRLKLFIASISTCFKAERLGCISSLLIALRPRVRPNGDHYPAHVPFVHFTVMLDTSTKVPSLITSS